MSPHHIVEEKERQALEEKAWSEVERMRTTTTDWGLAAECWIKWVTRDSKSWALFVTWLVENNVDAARMWDSFSRNSNDFECMAQDWVADEERDEFLALCGADKGTAEAMD